MDGHRNASDATPAQAQGAAKPLRARIDVGHEAAWVAPAHAADQVARDLTYAETEFHPGGPLGHRRRNVNRLLVRPGDGCWIIQAGLAPLVAERLTRAGVLVSVHDHRLFDPRATPSRPTLDAAQGPDREFLEAVVGSPRGLFETRGRSDLRWKVALLCRLFPAACVLIAVQAGRKGLRAVRRGLQNSGGGLFYTYDDYPWPFVGGRLVCSMQEFDMGAAHHFDVVVFADALQTLDTGTGRLQALARLGGRRVYGFADQDAALGGATCLRLQAAVGPFLFRTPDPRGEEAAVLVRRFRPSASPAAVQASALARKRAACWHNDARNDHVADVARAFAANDHKTLRAHGLSPAPATGDGTINVPAVAVLVESTEHGRDLLQRLPGWDMIHAARPPAGRAFAPPTDPFKPRPLDRTVVTCAAAARTEAFDVDVLIVAGGEGPPALGGFLPRSPGPRRQVVLIDMVDDFDQDAVRAARRRLRCYEARGWEA